MALYRKYRPATFADVVGQEHVTEPLSTALNSGRINHAYLFSGPRGCGKTSSARILARSLNCAEGPTATPCGVCDSCVALAPNGPGNVDVVELDAASHGGVDDTRELRDRAFYAPAQSRYRIFIVDEAHMVTTAGFNALLKIVEEPPEHLIFVFATTEPEKVLPTIRSRTHHYPFRLLAPKTMRTLIEKIVASESVRVDDAVYPLVIRAGGGSPRDTLSVLDQLLAGAEDDHVAYQRALSLLGATDVALIDEAVDALAADDAAALFGAVEGVVDAGHDPRRFATDLLERFRDLIVLQAVPDAAARGVVDGPEDVLERMREQAARLGTATLTRYAEVVHAGLGEMRGATAPRLLLEVVCARLLLPSASDTEAALLQRVERIETRLDMSIPASDEIPASAPAVPRKQFVRKSEAAPQPAPSAQAPAPARAPEPSPEPTPVPAREPDPVPEPPREASKPVEPEPVPPPPPPPPPVRPPAAPVVEAPATTPAAAVATGEPSAAAVRSMWTTVREKVRERSRTTEVMLAGAIVRAVEGDTLLLSHESAPLAKRLSEQRNADVIREALKDALGVNWKIRCDPGTAPASAAAPAREPQRGPAEPPPPPDIDDEESMLAEAGNSDPAAPRRDPEEAALELLQNELGARRIDG
ncbi:DNA polymerase III subunits gamma/tau [Mycolicibacterium austroafricanum]|uniref:DNA polymerase III subunit gamma/tau n=1 Tax=Mycolicibacterium austroafricanum TaxID=39687 RepID=A0ABT8HFI4_MYCAO|nr:MULTISPECIES: DNA polymerase III subunits gamma/tau [Mycolicibacterium]MDN4519516.1 DNA polymerase III subunits gamma/tau [Mycolicibacterium austroafricanum]UJL30508.1 DNA polymerase III subunits gamma/tau [Mycolicibacterium vanbaalenii]WND56394.1 DNA polymerase III subunits gamma/tau [Mycolicibacterium vanbaalenii]